MSTGERIKAQRRRIGMNADTLAERIGMSRSTIFRWEKGDIEKIDAHDLVKIAHVLNTSDAYLLGFIDDPDAMVSYKSESSGPVSEQRARFVAMAEQFPEELIPIAVQFLKTLLETMKKEV